MHISKVCLRRLIWDDMIEGKTVEDGGGGETAYHGRPLIFYSRVLPEWGGGGGELSYITQTQLIIVSVALLLLRVPVPP